MSRKAKKTGTTAAWKDDWDLPTAAARAVGIAVQTLSSAMQRGEIATDHLACGTRVVRVADVRDLKARPRKRGRKPRQ